MKQFRVLVAAIFSAAVVAAFSIAPVADAAPAPNVGRHAHYVLQQDGTKVWVGPDLCGNPNLQIAFNNFHANVHVGGANGGFDHEHNPNDIRSAACPS
jgi:hypothetical protein